MIPPIKLWVWNDGSGRDRTLVRPVVHYHELLCLEGSNVRSCGSPIPHIFRNVGDRLSLPDSTSAFSEQTAHLKAMRLVWTDRQPSLSREENAFMPAMKPRWNSLGRDFCDSSVLFVVLVSDVFGNLWSSFLCCWIFSARQGPTANSP